MPGSRSRAGSSENSHVQRVGKDRRTEQAVDPGLLRRGPSGLVRLGVGRQDEAKPEIVVQDA
jgi:hypothetical protein